MYKLTLSALAATTALAAMTAGGAQAQSYGPRPAYAAAGYDDSCQSNQFTLLGARAGVTVLGIDVGASGGLHVGLHSRCRIGGAAYAPAPVAYASPPAYAPPTGYGNVGYSAPPQPTYAQPVYSQPSYGYGAGGAGGYGYAYAGQAMYGARPPCGC